jgi:hypothetical protein
MRAGILRDGLPVRLLPLLAIGALLFAGCGDDSPPSRAKDGVLRVKLDEYRIIPDHLEVPAGRIHIIATNVGRLTHNLAIEAEDREIGEEVQRYGRTKTLHPGETGSEQEPITLAPGTYRLACTIANHDDLGQYGTLKVDG